MTETVYLLGAGLNQVVEDWHSLRPPMRKNFFQVVLKNPRFSNEHSAKWLDPLFDYIEKYWKKNRSELATSDFDLEECFTLLESQGQAAMKSGEEANARDLFSIEFSLKSLLAQVLSDFETFSVQSSIMRRFGEILCKEKPTIVSFNYDTITEAAIESASGLRGQYPESALHLPSINRDLTEEEIAFSHYHWNRPLGYGIQFDRVQLHKAGISSYVDGRVFYSNKQNKLYDWQLLKLHGSLNWFRFLPFRSFPVFEEEVTQPKWMESAVIHVESRWWTNRPPDFEGWFIDPLLITPILDKESLFDDPVYNRVFTPLWNRAAEALSKCKKLVIIGYAFSPTDFRTKRLFLEAFASNELNELIIINPNPAVVEKTLGLCHFKNPTVFQDLESYVGSVHQVGSQVFSPFQSDAELSTRFESGKRVVQALDLANFPVTGAFWFLQSSQGWKLFLVSPVVDLEGGESALSRVRTILSSIRPQPTVDMGVVVAVSPTSDLATIVRRLIRTGPGISTTRLVNNMVDNFPIEDLSLYRMQ